MTKLYKTLTLTLFAIGLSAAVATAQTIHEVDVTNAANGGFTPSHIDLVVGDIVRWTNSEGFHSVDGGPDQFPDNPEAFGNDAGSAGWVYEHTFTVSGEYNYWCGIHTQNMLGSLSVSESTNVNELEGQELLNLYPNPVVNELRWNISDGVNIQNAVLTLFDINGKKVVELRLAAQTSLDVSQYESGTYFFQIQDGDAILQSGKILVLTK